jgi:pimeloyl-ACP methyl ester carboxylesterase
MQKTWGRFLPSVVLRFLQGASLARRTKAQSKASVFLTLFFVGLPVVAAMSISSFGFAGTDAQTTKANAGKARAARCTELFSSSSEANNGSKNERESSLASAKKPNSKSTSTGSRIGFVEIEAGRSLNVAYLAPLPGKPTLVLLNGLTYRVGIWDRFVAPFEKAGYGILRYDMEGQGETLIQHGFPTAEIKYQNQTRDLALLLDSLGITTPVHILGLSYGGAIAMDFGKTYPKKVANLILMAPYLATEERVDSAIRTQVRLNRILFPLNPASDQQLYVFFYDMFMRQIVYATFPRSEPIVLEHPYGLEAAFRMAQGIRAFVADDYAPYLSKFKVHLVLARQDQYIPPRYFDSLWSQIPASGKVSRITINGTEHKMPEAVPEFAAAWAKLLIDGDARISGATDFNGEAAEHKATSGQTEIDLKNVW